MCTLTFLPFSSKKIFTFSRDEDVTRKNTMPEFHLINGKKIIFPRDDRKGGTWIATDSELFVCLLNAKNIDENTEKIYKKSRGNIVLKRFDFTDNDAFFEKICLDETAPFTLIIFQKKENKISEISWNGERKEIRTLDPEAPKIWSSSTLYSEKTRKLRENWYTDFLSKEELYSKNIWEFHQKKHTQISEINILMKRKDGKETTSISQVIFDEKGLSFRYVNLMETVLKEKEWKIQDLQLH